MNQTVSVPANVLRKAVKIVELASFGMKQAGDELFVRRTAAEKAAAAAPAVLEQMLNAGVLTENRKQAAAAMLGSHAETLELLKNAVDVIVELRKAHGKSAATELGAATDEVKAASDGGQDVHDVTKTPFVGGRTSYKKASDAVLSKILDDPRR